MSLSFMDLDITVTSLWLLERIHLCLDPLTPTLSTKLMLEEAALPISRFENIFTGEEERKDRVFFSTLAVMLIAHRILV